MVEGHSLGFHLFKGPSQNQKKRLLAVSFTSVFFAGYIYPGHIERIVMMIYVAHIYSADSFSGLFKAYGKLSLGIVSLAFRKFSDYLFSVPAVVDSKKSADIRICLPYGKFFAVLIATFSYEQSFFSHINTFDLTALFLGRWIFLLSAAGLNVLMPMVSPVKSALCHESG